jgi:hypothetical protein
VGAYFKGASIALVINALTILGWLYIGMWAPSVINVLVALLVVGYYGLEDKWSFPLGYWTIELLAILLWMTGIGVIMGQAA